MKQTLRLALCVCLLALSSHAIASVCQLATPRFRDGAVKDFLQNGTHLGYNRSQGFCWGPKPGVMPAPDHLRETL
jgi:hypothetical protein